MFPAFARVTSGSQRHTPPLKEPTDRIPTPESSCSASAVMTDSTSSSPLGAGNFSTATCLFTRHEEGRHDVGRDGDRRL